MRRLEDGRSILDDVRDEAVSLRSDLSADDREKLDEVEAMKTVRDLLARLKQSQEEGANLIDRTTVFLGSNLGDGSGHSVKHLPVLLAGGGFKHGQHLAFDQDNHPPLCNLFVSMLQRLGIETDQFGTSASTLTGLELAVEVRGGGVRGVRPGQFTSCSVIERRRS